MEKATDDNTKYQEIISNNEFQRLTKEVVSAFKNNASVWFIPNFDSLNESNNLLPYIQRCFISKYVTKSPNRNYEYYEAIGDKFWSSAMTSYIVLKFPNIITPSKITLSLSTYMSTAYQAELSRYFIPNYEKIIQISYPEYEKLSIDLRDKLAEDIFESFGGAIYLWSEKILPCSGILYVSNILRKMLDVKGDISEESMKKLDIDSVSKLVNLLRQLYTLNSIEYNKRYTDGKTPTIDLIVRFKNPSNEQKIYRSTASGKTIKAAKELASTMMIKQLEENGFSEDYINKVYNERIKNEREVINQIKAFLNNRKIETIKRKKEKKEREDDEDVIITTIDINTKKIKVSYSVSLPSGTKEISYEGTDMSRFDALRFLLDNTKRIFE